MRRAALLLLSAAAVSLPIALPAQSTVRIPLSYNFNGIAHAGETGKPDAPDGFRSISDRALDFTAGVPNDPVLMRYRVVAVPGVLDIVHLGNRNTVDNGNWRFDSSPDGDDIGIQPRWLVNPDQSGPQTTTLGSPILLGLSSTASVLFQISNGGGTFDVTFGYQSGRSRTAQLSGPDWFGGGYAGTDRVDSAGSGGNLDLTEQIVDLSGDAGESLVSITFSNRSNTKAGYAVIGVNVEAAPSPQRDNPIALNYNFNGIVHPGESGSPDDPGGYRSISDRGLDFSAGVPQLPMLMRYQLVATAGALDIVHLGNRDTVAGGTHAFDPSPDGDDIGIRPTWLPNVDQTGPQTTVLASPILLDDASTASVLFQISDGGGAFDVTFGFRGGTSVTSTLVGSDWLGGSFAGAGRIDSGTPGLGLALTERVVDLRAAAGLVLTQITFANRSNPDAGYAILATNVTGCLACANTGAVMPLGGGNGPQMTTTSTGALGCPLDWNVSGATANTSGIFLLDLSSTPLPLSAVFPSCTATLHVPSARIIVPAVTSATGTATLAVPPLGSQAACNQTIVGQYAELVPLPCPVVISDGLGIRIGNPQ